jgi:hypothetical protein
MANNITGDELPLLMRQFGPLVGYGFTGYPVFTASFDNRVLLNLEVWLRSKITKAIVIEKVTGSWQR